MRLSVAIPMHPARKLMVDELRSRLDVDGRSLRVLVDEHLDGVWVNSRRAWEAYDPGASHHLVLEDDVLPCENLLAGVEQALEYVPERSVVSLFSQEALVERALKKNSSWWIHPWSTAQALIIPVAMVEKFLRWSDKNSKPRLIVADARIMCWTWDEKIPVWHTAPDLVEHLGAGATMVTEKGWRKVNTPGFAGSFIGEEESALSIDWSREADDPPYFPLKSPEQFVKLIRSKTLERKVG